MSRVPLISSPCPLRWNSTPQAGHDFCGQCQRRVHNLDAMSASEREVFFAQCGGEVCVAYTVKRPLRAAIALGATLAAAATLAGSATAQAPEPVVMADSPYCEEEELMVVMVGGTKAGAELQWIDASEAAIPDKADLPEITASTWLPTPGT